MEHGKRRHWHVAKPVLGVLSVARIRQGAENLLQLVDQFVEYEAHWASYNTNEEKVQPMKSNTYETLLKIRKIL